MKPKHNLILSIATFLYFLILIIFSYNHIILNKILQGTLELLTIPFLILIIALFFTNIYSLNKMKWLIQNNYFYSLVINVLTISMLILATIFNF